MSKIISCPRCLCAPQRMNHSPGPGAPKRGSIPRRPHFPAATESGGKPAALHPGPPPRAKSIVAQESGIIGIFVAGRDLIDPLAQQIECGMLDIAPVALVNHQFFEASGQLEPLVELAQQHQARLTGDLAPGGQDRTYSAWSSGGAGKAESAAIAAPSGPRGLRPIC